MKHLLLSIMILSSVFSAGARNVKVYKGTSRYGSDVICTVKGNRIYKGNGSYTSDVLYNIKDGKVYKGTGRFIPAHPHTTRTSSSRLTAISPSRSSWRCFC